MLFILVCIWEESRRVSNLSGDKSYQDWSSMAQANGNDRQVELFHEFAPGLAKYSAQLWSHIHCILGRPESLAITAAQEELQTHVASNIMAEDLAVMQKVSNVIMPIGKADGAINPHQEKIW